MIVHRVRAAEPADRDAFLEMWRDFVALAPDEPGNHKMGELNWSRILDSGNGLTCLLAVDTHDSPLGFTLYFAFPFTWSRGDACYLQDIYVRSGHRGKGVAQAMIGQLTEIGRERGWYKIFWMTQSDNFAAQHLYDKVAKRVDYLRYDLAISEA